MFKRIVIGLDGTTNTPETLAKEGRLTPPGPSGTPGMTISHPSNVVRFTRAVSKQAADGTLQIKYYRRGVGTGNRQDAVIGGMTGDGIATNIEDAYRFIADNYQRGDQLYIVGFSRGAYTARSLSGFLHYFGILDPKNLERFPEAFYLYQTRQRAALMDLIAQFNNTVADSRSVPVYFLGVWDTVGSLASLGPFTESDVGYHDVELADNVTNAVHALAMHEMRYKFRPTLWSKCKAHQRVLQIWFPGSHSDVGGGNGNYGFNDATLEVMIREAECCQLEFDSSIVSAIAPSSAGEIEMSRDKLPFSVEWPASDLGKYGARQIGIFDSTIPPLRENVLLIPKRIRGGVWERERRREDRESYQHGDHQFRYAGFDPPGWGLSKFRYKSAYMEEVLLAEARVSRLPDYRPCIRAGQDPVDEAPAVTAPPSVTSDAVVERMKRIKDAGKGRKGVVLKKKGHQEGDS
jgi:hypothetical protein